jgi:hypothetical protein
VTQERNAGELPRFADQPRPLGLWWVSEVYKTIAAMDEVEAGCSVSTL